MATSGYSLLRLKGIPSLPRECDCPRPRVSIVVPVRNEEDTILECVRSLLDLEYDEKEIIIVEGNSEDGTAEILKGFRDEIVVVSEPPKPEGWVGKNWACHNGYLRARGELLLFTDGDTIHAPDSLRRSVCYLLSRKADMVSILPRLDMRSRWERVALPFIGHLILLYYGGPAFNDDNSDKWFANGQYILIRRGVYEKVGGHAEVGGELLEDIALAGAVKRSGFRARALYGAGAFGTKMYRNWSELWGGFVKNTFPAFHYRLRPLLAAMVALPTVFLIPFPMLFFSLRSLPTLSYVNILLGLACLSVLARMFVIYRKAGAGARYALLFPVAVVLEVMIMMASAFRVLSGRGLLWKGRLYALRT